MAPSLPLANGTVKVDLLDGGSLSTANQALVVAGSENTSIRLYDWCFHIQHLPSKRHILWDVGINSNESLYTPWVLDFQWRFANPVGPRQSLVGQLEDLGIAAQQIDTVIFSHAHWDHCRPIRDEFPSAKALFGPGTKSFCSPGHLVDGKSMSDIQWDGRFFDTHGFATEEWDELQDNIWIEWGPFKRALDFFGDGSFWIIDAPGHMPGNLCAAARLDDHDTWVILGSDCCHARAILDGKAEIAIFKAPDGSDTSLHTDLDAAHETIQNIRRAEVDFKMHVALGHDAEWMREGTDEVLHSLLSDRKKGEWLSRVKAGEAP